MGPQRHHDLHVPLAVGHHAVQHGGVLYCAGQVPTQRGEDKLIEGGGCGFNPKAPRYTVYPAGSNSPGALHFGVDLAKPSDYIRRVMPNWEEPPVHQDLIAFDMTVAAGGEKIIDEGFLVALRDPSVVEMAKRYGDPVELLEGGPA